jgi:hypothetical protein
MVRSTPVTEKISARKVKDDFVLYFSILDMFAVNGSIWTLLKMVLKFNAVNF